MLISKLVRILLIHGSAESQLIRVYSLILLVKVAYCTIKWKSGLVFCMLHCAKLICSSDSLFFTEVNILKSLFLANHYPAHFFDKILRKFFTLSSHHTQKNKNTDKCETCFFKVRYIGPAIKQFTKRVSELLYREFGLKLRLLRTMY